MNDIVSMNIAAFIREHIHTILDEWERFARELPIANALTKEALRDHAEDILLAIADDIEHAQTADQEEQKSTGHGPQMIATSSACRHGRDRVLEGFSVNDTMAEYRALRASVMRLWTREQAVAQDPVHGELIRFNEAIDQALTESLGGYALDRERRNRLYDTLLSASPDLSFIVDTDTRLIYGNAAVAKEFGAPVSVLRGKRFSEMEGHIQEQFDEHVRLVTRSRCTALGEISRIRRGETVIYEYLLVPVINETGAIEAVAGMARDVTDRKAAEEKYKRSAQYDDLTGLPNRHLFRDRLTIEIKRADRIHLPLALMFIDLDGFKQVNDLLGHEAGDELLQQGAKRISQCVRGTDTVARLGGDEFTLILTEIRHMPHVNMLAQHVLDALSRAFSIHGHDVLVSASVGIAIYPQDTLSATELLRHADQAMYAAKQSGRNRYCFFTTEMRNAAWRHRTRVAELRQAVAEQQLRVLYQPIVELEHGSVVGAEAQLHWQHPDKGLLPAHEFSDLAEEAGLAQEVDELVLKDVVDRADEWRPLHASPLWISIEKSSLALASKGPGQQCKVIVDLISRTQVPVALEVSEAMLLSEAPGSTDMLRQLTSSGVSLCLDEFGTGYSSLNSLTRFPLVALRIAPHLVRGILEDIPRSVTIGIIASGHALGLKVIAEGVENTDQEAQLRSMGCDYAQGVHYFGAMDAGGFKTLLEGVQG